MAKKKSRSRRQGWFSKILNIGIILLGLSRPISIIVRKPNAAGLQDIINESTFGLAQGKFDMKAGLKFYTPGGAAAGLGALKSYLLKKFPVR